MPPQKMKLRGEFFLGARSGPATHATSVKMAYLWNRNDTY